MAQKKKKRKVLGKGKSVGLLRNRWFLVGMALVIALLAVVGVKTFAATSYTAWHKVSTKSYVTQPPSSTLCTTRDTDSTNRYLVTKISKTNRGGRVYTDCTVEHQMREAKTTGCKKGITRHTYWQLGGWYTYNLCGITQVGATKRATVPEIKGSMKDSPPAGSKLVVSKWPKYTWRLTKVEWSKAEYPNGTCGAVKTTRTTEYWTSGIVSSRKSETKIVVKPTTIDCNASVNPKYGTGVVAKVASAAKKPVTIGKYTVVGGLAKISSFTVGSKTSTSAKLSYGSNCQLFNKGYISVGGSRQSISGKSGSRTFKGLKANKSYVARVSVTCSVKDSKGVYRYSNTTAHLNFKTDK